MTNCACCFPKFNSEVSLIHNILDFIMKNNRFCLLQTGHVHHMMIKTTMIIIVCSPRLGKIDWHHTSWTQRDPIIPSLCHISSGLNESITVSCCCCCVLQRQGDSASIKQEKKDKNKSGSQSWSFMIYPQMTQFRKSSGLNKKVSDWELSLYELTDWLH